MSGCLRSLSIKLTPFNAIVFVRQPAAKLENKTLLRKSLIFADVVSIRNLTSGRPNCSLSAVALVKEHNSSSYCDGWREILDQRCQEDVGVERESGCGCIAGDGLTNRMYSQSNLPYYTYQRLPVVLSSGPSSPLDAQDGKEHCKASGGGGSGGDTQGNDSQKASPQQLQFIYDKLADNIPLLFAKVMDYEIYDPQLKFTNNIRGGITTVGLYHYVKQVALLRTIGHIRFAYVRMNVLNMAIRHDESCVIVRWRISGVSGLRVMLMFWKYKLWRVRQTVNESEVWYDGVSTFYVGADGLIKHHIADKMVPDDNRAVVDADKSTVAAKLALLLGLVPRPQMGEFGDLGALIQSLNCSSNNSIGTLSNHSHSTEGSRLDDKC